MKLELFNLNIVFNYFQRKNIFQSNKKHNVRKFACFSYKKLISLSVINPINVFDKPANKIVKKLVAKYKLKRFCRGSQGEDFPVKDHASHVLSLLTPSRNDLPNVSFLTRLKYFTEKIINRESFNNTDFNFQTAVFCLHEIACHGDRWLDREFQSYSDHIQVALKLHNRFLDHDFTESFQDTVHVYELCLKNIAVSYMSQCFDNSSNLFAFSPKKVPKDPFIGNVKLKQAFHEIISILNIDKGKYVTGTVYNSIRTQYHGLYKKVVESLHKLYLELKNFPTEEKEQLIDQLLTHYGLNEDEILHLKSLHNTLDYQPNINSFFKQFKSTFDVSKYDFSSHDTSYLKEMFDFTVKIPWNNLSVSWNYFNIDENCFTALQTQITEQLKDKLKLKITEFQGSLVRFPVLQTKIKHILDEQTLDLNQLVKLDDSCLSLENEISSLFPDGSDLRVTTTFFERILDDLEDKILFSILNGSSKIDESSEYCKLKSIYAEVILTEEKYNSLGEPYQSEISAFMNECGVYDEGLQDLQSIFNTFKFKLDICVDLDKKLYQLLTTDLDDSNVMLWNTRALAFYLQSNLNNIELPEGIQEKLNLNRQAYFDKNFTTILTNDEMSLYLELKRQPSSIFLKLQSNSDLLLSLLNKLKTDDVNNSFLQPIINNMSSLFNFPLARYLRPDLSSSVAELVKTLNRFPIEKTLTSSLNLNFQSYITKVYPDDNQLRFDFDLFLFKLDKDLYFKSDERDSCYRMSSYFSDFTYINDFSSSVTNNTRTLKFLTRDFGWHNPLSLKMILQQSILQLYRLITNFDSTIVDLDTLRATNTTIDELLQQIDFSNRFLEKLGIQHDDIHQEEIDELKSLKSRVQEKIQLGLVLEKKREVETHLLRFNVPEAFHSLFIAFHLAEDVPTKQSKFELIVKDDSVQAYLKADRKGSLRSEIKRSAESLHKLYLNDGLDTSVSSLVSNIKESSLYKASFLIGPYLPFFISNQKLIPLLGEISLVIDNLNKYSDLGEWFFESLDFSTQLEKIEGFDALLKSLNKLEIELMTDFPAQYNIHFKYSFLDMKIKFLTNLLEFYESNSSKLSEKFRYYFSKISSSDMESLKHVILDLSCLEKQIPSLEVDARDFNVSGDLVFSSLEKKVSRYNFKVQYDFQILKSKLSTIISKFVSIYNEKLLKVKTGFDSINNLINCSDISDLVRRYIRNKELLDELLAIDCDLFQKQQKELGVSVEDLSKRSAELNVCIQNRITCDGLLAEIEQNFESFESLERVDKFKQLLVINQELKKCRELIGFGRSTSHKKLDELNTLYMKHHIEESDSLFADFKLLFENFFEQDITSIEEKLIFIDQFIPYLVDEDQRFIKKRITVIKKSLELRKTIDPLLDSTSDVDKQELISFCKANRDHIKARYYLKVKNNLNLHYSSKTSMIDGRTSLKLNSLDQSDLFQYEGVFSKKIPCYVVHDRSLSSGPAIKSITLLRSDSGKLVTKTIDFIDISFATSIFYEDPKWLECLSNSLDASGVEYISRKLQGDPLRSHDMTTPRNDYNGKPVPFPLVSDDEIEKKDSGHTSPSFSVDEEHFPVVSTPVGTTLAVEEDEGIYRHSLETLQRIIQNPKSGININGNIYIERNYQAKTDYILIKQIADSNIFILQRISAESEIPEHFSKCLQPLNMYARHSSTNAMCEQTLRRGHAIKGGDDVRKLPSVRNLPKTPAGTKHLEDDDLCFIDTRHGRFISTDSSMDTDALKLVSEKYSTKIEEAELLEFELIERKCELESLMEVENNYQRLQSLMKCHENIEFLKSKCEGSKSSRVVSLFNETLELWRGLYEKECSRVEALVKKLEDNLLTKETGMLNRNLGKIKTQVHLLPESDKQEFLQRLKDFENNLKLKGSVEKIIKPQKCVSHSLNTIQFLLQYQKLDIQKSSYMIQDYQGKKQLLLIREEIDQGESCFKIKEVPYIDNLPSLYESLHDLEPEWAECLNTKIVSLKVDSAVTVSSAQQLTLANKKGIRAHRVHTTPHKSKLGAYSNLPFEIKDGCRVFPKEAPIDGLRFLAQTPVRDSRRRKSVHGMKTPATQGIDSFGEQVAERFETRSILNSKNSISRHEPISPAKMTSKKLRSIPVTFEIGSRIRTFFIPQTPEQAGGIPLDFYRRSSINQFILNSVLAGIEEKDHANVLEKYHAYLPVNEQYNTMRDVCESKIASLSSSSSTKTPSSMKRTSASSFTPIKASTISKAVPRQILDQSIGPIRVRYSYKKSGVRQPPLDLEFKYDISNREFGNVFSQIKALSKADQVSCYDKIIYQIKASPNKDVFNDVLRRINEKRDALNATPNRRPVINKSTSSSSLIKPRESSKKKVGRPSPNSVVKLRKVNAQVDPIKVECTFQDKGCIKILNFDFSPEMSVSQITSCLSSIFKLPDDIKKACYEKIKLALEKSGNCDSFDRVYSIVRRRLELLHSPQVSSRSTPKRVVSDSNTSFRQHVQIFPPKTRSAKKVDKTSAIVPFQGEELKMYESFRKKFEICRKSNIKRFIQYNISRSNLIKYLDYYKSLHDRGTENRIKANLAKSFFDRLTKMTKVRTRPALKELMNTVDGTTA